MSQVENNAELNGPTKQLGGCTGKGFMPGQSGNPGGRPKKLPITEIFLELLDDATDRALLKNNLRGVIKGKSMVAKVMLVEKMAERTEGKVVQPLEGTFEVNVQLADRLSRSKQRIDGESGT